MAYQALLALAAAAVVTGSGGVSAGESLVLMGAGVSQGLGTVVHMRAMQIGKVAIVGPLVSLEGIFAALLGVATGEHLAPLAGAGLAVAFTGGAVTALGQDSQAEFPAATGGLLAACLYGVTLWVLATDDLDIWLSLFVLNTASAAVILLASLERPSHFKLPRAVHVRLLAAALGSLAGFALFAAGARHGSLVITALLASQFSVVAAGGAFVLLRERLTARQLAGVALVAVGVALVAIAGSG